MVAVSMLKKTDYPALSTSMVRSLCAGFAFNFEGGGTENAAESGSLSQSSEEIPKKGRLVNTAPLVLLLRCHTFIQSSFRHSSQHATGLDRAPQM